MMTAIRDFTMTVARGEFACVVGPTGCGKSTTLNLVTGLLRPTTGNVRVMGNPVTDISRDIGFVFQADALFPWRSVIDNVAAGPLYRGTPKAQAYERARDWIARVGLGRIRKSLSAPALGRHAQARRAGANLHQPAQNPADG